MNLLNISIISANYNQKTRYKYKKYPGFTLVELIVVIVILAILATIAFLSFNSYSSSSRDSVRLADVNNFSKSLELYQIKTGTYPSPDNSFNITYSGGLVWYQGTLGDTLTRKLGNLSKKVVDPLSNTEYTYSLLSSGNSYQIKANYEGDNISFENTKYKTENELVESGEYIIENNNSVILSLSKNLFLSLFGYITNRNDNLIDPFDFAPQRVLPSGAQGDNLNLNQISASNGNPKIAYIKGNYQGIVTRTTTGSMICILAIPSIITNTGTTGNSYEIGNNTLSGTLLYHGQSNTNGLYFNPNKVVYCSTSLPTNDTNSGLTNIASGIINAYSGTQITTLNPTVQTIVNTPTSQLSTLGGNIVSGQLGGSANVSSTLITNINQSFTICTSAGQTYTGVTTYSSCDTPDKVVCTGSGVGQVWAMCNAGATTSIGWNTVPAQTPGNGTTSLPTNRVQSVQGNYYQWGRVNETTSTAIQSGPVASEINSNFYTSGCDWITTQNDNLWGGSTTTSASGYYSGQTIANKALMQGPCNNGYHVPTMKEWCDTAISINPTVTCSAAWYNDTSVATSLRLPLSGFRNLSDASYNDQGSYGLYWTSTPNSPNGNVLYISSSQIYPVNRYFRANGLSIRCLKN